MMARIWSGMSEVCWVGCRWVWAEALELILLGYSHAVAFLLHDITAHTKSRI
jgi:hypothetical protein